MKVLLIFSQSHLDFRMSELALICDVLKIPVDISTVNVESHAFILNFESEDDVHQLLSRSMLVKFAFQYFHSSNSFDELCNWTKTVGRNSLQTFDDRSRTYSFRSHSIGKKKNRQSANLIKRFLESFVLKSAKVDLASPMDEFFLIEEYFNEYCSSNSNLVPSAIYFGKLIAEGQSRLRTQYNLQERCYIGNTTMDPELSFIQANIAQVSAGDIVLDPFVGTGGLLLAAAHFGAFTIGTEINHQTARASGKSSRMGADKMRIGESIKANFEQQNTEGKLLSIIIADASKHGMWSKNAQVDVIIADPPYGVREKSRKLMAGTEQKEEEKSQSQTGRFPEKEVYALGDTFSDLLTLAANICVVGGRVSFWYPVIRADYNENYFPRHPAMQLISNCEQILTTKSSRRLITYRKTRKVFPQDRVELSNNGVNNFRKMLFEC